MEVSKDFTATTGPPGRSFSVRVFGHEMDEEARANFYDAYEASYPGEVPYFSPARFSELIDAGHIHCGGVFDADGRPVAGFGIELMREPMMHLSFLFYAGLFHRRMFEPMFEFLHEALQGFKAGQGSDNPGAARVVGRKGWKGILKRRGIAIDADGFIREDQKVVRDGYSGWLN